jgi:hypothetical protein
VIEQRTREYRDRAASGDVIVVDGTPNAQRYNQPTFMTYWTAKMLDEGCHRTSADVKLDEAMIGVLREHGGWMDRNEPAREITNRGLYRRQGGSGRGRGSDARSCCAWRAPTD